MNIIQQQDIERFANDFPLSEKLANKSVLITGATGLVGQTLVRCINGLNCGAKILCPARNLVKANQLFGDILNQITVIECDLAVWLRSLDTPVDYIIHCASPTDGLFMKQHPVETFDFIYDTTKSLLDYSCRNRVSSMVFISSVEYYGQILDEVEIDESYQGYADVDNPRNSYPIGKRAAEFLCKAYFSEYGVPVKCARLTQTFGAGVSLTDNRVFAQFTKSIMNSCDIVLHTDGTSAKQYCYITDTVSAILYIMLTGKNGMSYNVANPDTYISIRDLACHLIKEFNPNVELRFDIKENNNYASVTKLKLNTDQIYQLGWRPQYGLTEMFKRLLEYYRSMQ